MKFELRAIIWNTKDVAFKDGQKCLVQSTFYHSAYALSTTGASLINKPHSDIFVRCYPEGLKPQVKIIHELLLKNKNTQNCSILFSAPMFITCLMMATECSIGE